VVAAAVADVAAAVNKAISNRLSLIQGLRNQMYLDDFVQQANTHNGQKARAGEEHNLILGLLNILMRTILSASL
jgi:hypothetical protein